ncbi:hypothetical protein FH972_022300 [Carpinus fangiana]|uniref:Cytochrome P450 n=1 Tax=Carpinus fangiana TaxID=176857 RepID=A0A5N6KS78_9ROSI|nr:hypothetical protein FH972_022300 [Carpinus fangiana]
MSSSKNPNAKATSTRMFAVPDSRSPSSTEYTLNALPSRIMHDGPVELAPRHWTPTMMTLPTTEDHNGAQGQIQTSYFRGRKLLGKEMPIPDTHHGAVLRVTEKTVRDTSLRDQAMQDLESRRGDMDAQDYDEEVEELRAAAARGELEEEIGVMETVGNFDGIVMWGHETVPGGDEGELVSWFILNLGFRRLAFNRFLNLSCQARYLTFGVVLVPSLLFLEEIFLEQLVPIMGSAFLPHLPKHVARLQFLLHPLVALTLRQLLASTTIRKFSILAPALVVCVALGAGHAHLDELARHVHANKIARLARQRGSMADLYGSKLSTPCSPRAMRGPPTLPIIGNIRDIKYNAAEKYREWSERYGAVYQIQLGVVPVIVVNTAAAAKEIFGNHSQALSSRPVFYTFHKVLSNTAGTTIGTSPFSDSLKRRRKGAASALNKPSVQTYLDHLDIETHDFIAEAYQHGDAGKTPVDPIHMVQRLSLSLALTLNWGRRILQSDPMFAEITYVEEEISRFRSTTGNLQDYIPLLRLNPFSFGSRRAREMRARRDVYLTRLNADLDARMRAGTHKPCIQANVIEDKEASLNKEELTSISLTMLSGGLDTFTTLMQWSLALLAQRPDIQRAAHAAIVAAGYTPADLLTRAEVDDDYAAPRAPYIAALVRECLRYYTVLRLALPRATVKDIRYAGKRIPAGATVFLNAWACNMDPAVHAEPRAFAPARWLDPRSGRFDGDKPLFTYGVGYRMCAGSLLANRELYLVFLRLVAAYELREDDTPGVRRVEVDPVRGSADPTSLVTMPERYKVYFVPREEGVLRGALARSERGEVEV